MFPNPHSETGYRDGPAPEATVIVPTLNEAGNIGPLIDRLFAQPGLADRIEVIVADDASTDGTRDEVRERSARRPVRLVEPPGPADLTGAVLHAARHARGRWCVVMDADGSHPPERVADLLRPLEDGRADVAVGSRHVTGGEIADWPKWRHTVSRVAALLAWPFTSVRDPMSGFFATSTERLSSLEPLRAGYKVLLELLVRSKPEPRVIEIPFRFADRHAGESKMTVAVQWLFVRRLAALGGARLTLGNATRFGAVGLSGVVIDLAIFWLLQSLGATLATAHFGSFLAATLSNFALNYHWSFAGTFRRDEPAWKRYPRFLLTALLALCVRGGVLALLVGLGIPAAVAIVPAVAATAVINYLGSIFYVFPAREGHHDPAVRWRLAALALIALSLLIRWLYLGRVELIFDEMYYWVYQARPALSYLDHPPLTAWLIWIGTQVAGDTPAGVRLATVVLAPIAMVYAYLFGRDVAGKTRGLLAAMLVATVPGWLATGFLMTTDAALVTAWLAALFHARRALVDGRRGHWWPTGIAIGLGMLAKYTAAFLGPAILVFALVHAPARRRLADWRPYAAALLCFALFSPVLVWNAQHDWASFTFQATRRIAEDAGFGSHLLLVHTVAMLAPLAGLVALYALGPARR
ncbi:MAG: glycosyltransferase family 39 protein, partial [Wenzhouxiangellaceae bacterium]|nr:glycosyltransferase family 39 protein [Wenzhouxiangellaceae bacterium]